MTQVFNRDDDGNVTNPPILPEYEQRIADAQNRADVDEIQRQTDLYAQAREDEIRRIEGTDSEDATPEDPTPEDNSPKWGDSNV